MKTIIGILQKCIKKRRALFCHYRFSHPIPKWSENNENFTKASRMYDDVSTAPKLKTITFYVKFNVCKSSASFHMSNFDEVIASISLVWQSFIHRFDVLCEIV